MSTAELKKSTILEILSGVVDESTLTKILNLLSQPKNTDTEKIPDYVVERIKVAKKQIKAGEFKENDSIRAKYKERFPDSRL